VTDLRHSNDVPHLMSMLRELGEDVSGQDSGLVRDILTGRLLGFRKSAGWDSQALSFLIDSVHGLSQDKQELFRDRVLIYRFFIASVVSFYESGQSVEAFKVYDFVYFLRKDNAREGGPLQSLMRASNDLRLTARLLENMLPAALRFPNSVQMVKRTFEMFQRNRSVDHYASHDCLTETFLDYDPSGELLSWYFHLERVTLTNFADIRGSGHGPCSRRRITSSNLIKSLSSARVIPLLLMHVADQPLPNELSSANVVNREIALNVMQVCLDYELQEAPVKSFLADDALMDGLYELVDPMELIRSLFLQKEETLFCFYIEAFGNNRTIPRQKRLRHNQDRFVEFAIGLVSGQLSLSDFLQFSSFRQAHNSQFLVLVRMSLVAKGLMVRFIEHSFEEQLDDLVSKVKTRQEQLRAVVKVAKEYCRDCPDFQEKTSAWEGLTSLDCPVQTDLFVSDPGLSSLLANWPQLKNLLTDFGFIFKLNCGPMADGLTQTEDRLKVLADMLVSLDHKVAAFMDELGKHTRAEMVELIGRNNQNRVVEEVIGRYLGRRHPDDETKGKVVRLLLEEAQVEAYVSLLRVFEERLQFNFNGYRDKVVFWEALRAARSETLQTTMDQVGTFESLFDNLHSVSSYLPVLSVFEHLDSALEFISQSKDQYETMKEFSTELEGFDLKWEDIDNLPLVEAFFLRVRGGRDSFDRLSEVCKDALEIAQERPFKGILDKVGHTVRIMEEFRCFKKEISQNSDTKVKAVQLMMSCSDTVLELFGDFRLKARMDQGGSVRVSERKFSEVLETRNSVKMKSGFGEGEGGVEGVGGRQRGGLNKQFVERFLAFFDLIESVRNSFERMRTFGFIFEGPQKVQFRILDSDLTELSAVANDFTARETAFVAEMKTALHNSFLSTFLHGPLFEHYHKLLSKTTLFEVDSTQLKYLGVDHVPGLNELYAAAVKRRPASECLTLCLVSFIEKELSPESRFVSPSDHPCEIELSKSVVFWCKADNGNVFTKVLTLSHVANQRLPCFHNVLFAHAESRMSEVTSFVFRVFACKTNEAFVLVWPEALRHEMQREVLELVAQLGAKRPRRSHLFVVSNDRHCYLVQKLEENKLLKALVLDEEATAIRFDSNLKQRIGNVCFVSSDKVLSGKSHFIAESCKAMADKHRRVLTLTGGFDKAKTFATLKKAFQIRGLVLHVEVEHVTPERVPEVDRFLFGLLVLGFVGNDLDLLFPPPETLVYVELSSSYLQDSLTRLQVNGLGFRTKRIEDSVSLLYPTSSLALDFLRRMSGRDQGDFNRQTVRPRELTADDNEVFTNILTRQFHDDKHYLRAKSRMFEQIVKFVAKLILDTTEPDYDIRNEVYGLVCGMATDLSRSGIDKIKNSQDSIIRDMLAEDLDTVLRKWSSDKLSGDGLVLNRQVSASPWNNSNVTLVLWMRKRLVLLASDNSRLTPGLVRQLREQNKKRTSPSHLPSSPSSSHFDFMEELMWLNSAKETRRICPRCLCFEESLLDCPRCPRPSKEERCLDLNRMTDSEGYPNPYSKFSLMPIANSSCDYRIYIQLIEEEFTVTRDNFVKMLSVFIRGMSGLPVVIMGETGCGKTSLVRFLTTRVLNHLVEIFCVHAGVKESDIVSRMVVLRNKSRTNPDRKVWFVFDEFNTTDAFGLIKSIMLTRSCGGDPFDNNVIFLATCNPYNLKNENLASEEVVGLKKKLVSESHGRYRLLYTVHPIPDSLLFYTFDFGQLSRADEERYIGIWLKKRVGCQEKRSMLAVLIAEVHAEIKRYFGKSAVSLRDLKRFIVLFEFFKGRYFKVKERVESGEVQRDTGEGDSGEVQRDSPTGEGDSGEVQRDSPSGGGRVDLDHTEDKSLVLSLLLCYFVRVSSDEERGHVLAVITRNLGVDSSAVLGLFRAEVEYLMARFELGKGIVVNQALSENLFCMFVCTLNKVPMLVCGKPGSSKSLSVQLLFSRLKGKASALPFFRSFDELIQVPYQGSEYSTSAGVEKVFAKAEGAVGLAGREGRTAVVVFDEIGLAEISPNNPLKVLHSKLEIENVRVAFVGLSNWQLDSSKMNRVLCLSRRDPDLHELQQTAEGLFESVLATHHDLLRPKFRQLAQTFHSVREGFRGTDNEDLYGLRDFYYLVRTVAVSFNTHLATTIKGVGSDSVQFSQCFYECVLQSVMRNFNCSEEGWRGIWREFCGHNREDQSVWAGVRDFGLEELIRANLAEVGSRFLMVVTDRTAVHSKVYRIVEQFCQGREGMQRQVLIGSKFPKDLSSEAYHAQTINQVIMHMEQGTVLVIHRFEKVFTSLYDLFNQNYRRHGGQNFCRVVQGGQGKSSYVVSDNFKVVVFMTPEELKRADVPLINRFEKYFLNDQASFLKEEAEQTDKVHQVMGEVFPKLLQGGSLREPKECIANFSRDSYTNWVDQVSRRMEGVGQPGNHQGHRQRDRQMEQTGNQQMGQSVDHPVDHPVDQSVDHPVDRQLHRLNDFRRCLMDLLMDVSNLKLSTHIFDNLPNDEHLLLSRFLARKALTFPDYVHKRMAQSAQTFSLVFTFTLPHLSVRPLLADTQLTELSLSAFHQEVELKTALIDFVKSDRPLLVLKVDALKESQHMFSLQHLIASLAADRPDRRKHFVLVVCYAQNRIADCAHFSQDKLWEAVFIDSLRTGLSETMSKVIMAPQLLASIDRLRSAYTAKFDHSIDTVFRDLNLSRHGESVLRKLEEYYSDFSRKYPSAVVEVLVERVFRMCHDDPELKRHSTVFDYMRRDSHSASNAETFAERIESCLMGICHQKQWLNVVVIERHCLIHSLRSFARNGLDDLVAFWLEVFGRLCAQTRESTLRTDQPLVLHELEFPMSLTQFEWTAKYLRQRSEGGFEVVDERAISEGFMAMVVDGLLQDHFCYKGLREYGTVAGGVAQKAGGRPDVPAPPPRPRVRGEERGVVGGVGEPVRGQGGPGADALRGLPSADHQLLPSAQRLQESAGGRLGESGKGGGGRAGRGQTARPLQGSRGAADRTAVAARAPGGLLARYVQGVLQTEAPDPRRGADGWAAFPAEGGVVHVGGDGQAVQSEE
jgi:hypothetical protein